MKRVLLFVFFLTVLKGVQAQRDTLQAIEVSINPSINYRWINASNADLNWLKETQDSLQKPNFGIGAQVNHEFGINEKRSYFMGVSYCRQGYQYKKNSLEGFRFFEIQDHFIQFPIGLNVFYRLNERIQLAVQPSILPGAMFMRTVSYVQNEDQTTRKMETYPKSVLISFHAQVAAGIVARINQHWKFRANLFFQQQLKPSSKGDMNVLLNCSGVQIALSRALHH